MSNEREKKLTLKRHGSFQHTIVLVRCNFVGFFLFVTFNTLTNTVCNASTVLMDREIVRNKHLVRWLIGFANLRRFL